MDKVHTAEKQNLCRFNLVHSQYYPLKKIQLWNTGIGNEFAEKKTFVNL